MTESERQPLLRPLIRSQDVEATSVFPVIHTIRSDIIHFVDTPLSHDALMAPDLTYTLVRPLREKYGALQFNGNKSVVFCILLNRVHFLRDQNLATQTLSHSRAELCEILATQLLRDCGDSVLDLTLILTTSWPVYSGANPNIISFARNERHDDLEDRVGNAIEMAILGRSKRFIKSSSCQKVINSIWSGQCVYQAEGSHSFLSDNYKRTPVHFYDPHKAPLLDHYRLKVPAIRSVLEYSNFVVLFFLFVLALELSKLNTINMAEILFMVYALGFALEKLAALQEHGIAVYFKGTWNGFDLAFVTTYGLYAFLRIYGVYYDDLWARATGIDCLALIACLMFPRLAFVTLKNNLMVLSLRAMIVQFIVLMFIAAFCFCGFLYALWTLSRNEAGFTPGTIAWWMLDLWFGLDASGFDKATQFHPFFGPVLMVTYACLSNTLLLTVLVSILSHTFSTINEDAAAEAMFRKAVSTIEGVKADVLFSYQPPINVVALFIMLPASYILSPRWFHKLNVFMIRVTSFPILLLIAWYERQAKRMDTSSFHETLSALVEEFFDGLPRQIKRMTFFEGLVGYDADIEAIFEIANEFEDSALDTTEARTYGPGDDTRVGAQSTIQIPRSGTDPKPSSLPSKPVSRNRLTSLSRSPEGPSPLAQIFQPIVVQNTATESADLGPSAISLGPAHRRRLSSIQSRHRTASTERPAPQAQSTGVKKRPTIDTTRLLDAPLSASPDQVQAPQEWPAKPGNEGDDEWKRCLTRLMAMEQRQERIENMLIQLTDQSKTR